jgi:hypothetical protein
MEPFDEYLQGTPYVDDSSELRKAVKDLTSHLLTRQKLLSQFLILLEILNGALLLSIELLKPLKRKISHRYAFLKQYCR